MNKNFAQSFVSDDAGFYPLMSQSCLKKAAIRSADGSTEILTIGNFSFVNGNVVKYTKEQGSKQVSGQFYYNYTYTENCSTKSDTTTSKENTTQPGMPAEVRDIDGNVYHALKIGNQIG